MDFFAVAEARRSVRAFQPKAVESEKLQKILETVNRAPSAGNLQAFEVYIARDPADRQAIAAAALGQTFAAQAPVALVFCAHPARASARYGERGSRLYAPQDATIACTYAMLAAQSLGLATVWVGAFSDEKVRLAIRAPEGQIPVAILPIGYPAESPPAPPRRRLEDLVREIGSDRAGT